jgi:hypothetical protein
LHPIASAPPSWQTEWAQSHPVLQAVSASATQPAVQPVVQQSGCCAQTAVMQGSSPQRASACAEHASFQLAFSQHDGVAVQTSSTHGSSQTAGSSGSPTKQTVCGQPVGHAPQSSAQEAQVSPVQKPSPQTQAPQSAGQSSHVSPSQMPSPHAQDPQSATHVPQPSPSQAPSPQQPAPQIRVASLTQMPSQ